MEWYFYELPNDEYGQPIFRTDTDGSGGYIATTEAADFNQATLQLAQWLIENGYNVSDGYSVINGDEASRQ